MSARMRLRRADGKVYMDRWGWEWTTNRPALGARHGHSLFGIFIHKFTAPDPGLDLHDHPWWFASFNLWGGYEEERSFNRDAVTAAWVAEVAAHADPPTAGMLPRRGALQQRVRHRWRTMRTDECHRVVHIFGKVCWTLVIHGPRRRNWGFYTPTGWVPWDHYSRNRRDMWEE